MILVIMNFMGDILLAINTSLFLVIIFYLVAVVLVFVVVAVSYSYKTKQCKECNYFNIYISYQIEEIKKNN